MGHVEKFYNNGYLTWDLDLSLTIVWVEVTGPVGNPESYPVHNQIHGLVPIDYESKEGQFW